MYRKVFSAGLWAGAFVSAAVAAVDHTLSHSVVQIRAMPGTGRVFYGSGVVVGSDRVVTNCHVTREAKRIMVGKGADQYSVVEQRVDTQKDLCLLTTPGIPFPKAKIGSSQHLKVGEGIYLYGYPLGLGLAFSQGTVRALHPFQGARVIETSANFTLGASGGGFFDPSGRLVGLATFLTSGHTGGYYAIPADWIRTVEGTRPLPIEPLGRRLSFWEDMATLPGFLKSPAKLANSAQKQH